MELPISLSLTGCSLTNRVMLGATVKQHFVPLGWRQGRVSARLSLTITLFPIDLL